MPADEDDGSGPDILEQAGILEADVGAKFDQQLASIDPNLNIDNDPQVHQSLRPEMMFIRGELRQAKLQTLAKLERDARIPATAREVVEMLQKSREFDNKYYSNENKVEIYALRFAALRRAFGVRRAALKTLLLSDFRQENQELNKIGLSYAPRDNC